MSSIHILSLCAGTKEIVFFESSVSINLFDAKARCEELNLEISKEELKFTDKFELVIPIGLPQTFWLFDDDLQSDSATVGDISGGSLSTNTKDRSEFVDGFVCVSNEGELCTQEGLGTRSCVGETEFLLAFGNIARGHEEGNAVCNEFNSVLSTIQSEEEFRVLIYSIDLELSSDITGFLTAMKFEILPGEIQVLFGTPLFFDNFVIDEAFDNFFNGTNSFPWALDRPRVGDKESFVVLKRSSDNFLLSTVIESTLTNLDGPVCRIEESQFCLNKVDDDFLSLEIIFVLGGLFCFGLLVLLLICRIFCRSKRKESRKEKQTKKVDDKESSSLPNIEGDLEDSARHTDEDKFSIYTGLTDLPSERSREEYSIKSMLSTRSQISAADKTQNQVVRSAISSPSSLSAISQNLLRVSPFVRNIKNKQQVKTFIIKVALAIEEMLVNTDEGCSSEAFHEFNASRIPNVEIGFYLQRLINGLDLWFNDDNPQRDEKTGIRALLLALHFIRKTKEKHALTQYNIHKILCTSLLVAAKFIEDEVLTNEYWGEIAGLDVEVITSLEQIFCFSLGFNFDVEEDEVEKSLEAFSLERTF